MKVLPVIRRAAFAFLAISVALPCQAADPIGAVQAASVAVAVKGIRVADSAPVEVHGSGFFTSQDGYLVTSAHLVSDLLDKGVDHRTLTYTVTPEGVPFSRQMGAVVAWKSDVADLMVLRARIGTLRVNPLKPNLAARSELRLAATPIFTGGYPAGYDFVADRGYLKSFEGPADSAAPAWVTNMGFKQGQSGSPVVTEDGRVVAVVKAVDLDAASLGILVPIRDVPRNYWQDDGTWPPSDWAGIGWDWPSAAWCFAALLAALLAIATARALHAQIPVFREPQCPRQPEKDVLT